jgi:hypothetical protein
LSRAFDYRWGRIGAAVTGVENGTVSPASLRGFTAERIIVSPARSMAFTRRPKCRDDLLNEWQEVPSTPR